MTGEYISRTPEETLALGEQLAAHLSAGSVVSLRGPLGSGKTVLAKGISRYLGITEPVVSPTYTILQEYAGILTLYHLDLYRIASLEEFDQLGVEEYFYGGGITLIEWSELIDELLPPHTVYVSFALTEEQQRLICIRRNEQNPGITADELQNI